MSNAWEARVSSGIAVVKEQYPNAVLHSVINNTMNPAGVEQISQLERMDLNFWAGESDVTLISPDFDKWDVPFSGRIMAGTSSISWPAMPPAEIAFMEAQRQGHSTSNIRSVVLNQGLGSPDAFYSFEFADGSSVRIQAEP